MKRLGTITTIVAAILVFCGSAFSATEDLIINRLFEQLQLDTSVYEIEVLSHRIKTEITDSCTFTLRPLTMTEPLGLYSLVAEIKRDGLLVERSQVRTRIRKFKTVLVSRDRIKRHDLLDESKFELKRMEVTSLRELPLSSFHQVEGYRSKRNLQKGTVITSGRIELVPDIEVGREVAIIFDDGLCKITVPGRSMQSGSRGDNIRIKNKASGKIIMARVIDGSRVSVDM